MNPLKNITLFIVLVLFGITGYSQKMQNEKYETILKEIIENETVFDSKLKMSNNKQSYFEGTVAVTFLETGEETQYNYSFYVWNNKCKSFLVKDDHNNIIKPEILFKDKKAIIKNKNNIDVIKDFTGELQVEKYILSCMMFWLNQKYS